MVQSGSTTGGSNDPALFFGVTGESLIDTIDIDWPSGSRTLLTDRVVNQRMTVRELTLDIGDGSAGVDEFGRLHDLETSVGSHLNDLRLYVAVDGGAPVLLGPDDFQVVEPVRIVDHRATSQLLSLDGTLRVDLTVDLRNAGASRKGIKLRVQIANLGPSTIDIDHYIYYDWNIGDAGGDQGRSLSPNRIRQRDAAAVPGRNFDMSASGGFAHWEIDDAATLLDKLEQAVSAIDLVDTPELVTGDVGNAMQFEASIPAGGSWQVIHNFLY
jgi:hypothetical protein